MGYTLSDQVVSRVIDDETVLLDLASGTYFGLDSIGTIILQHALEGQTHAEIVQAIEKRFNAERARIEQDVETLLEELISASLLVRSETPND